MTVTTVALALRAATRRLAATSDTARLDAELLMAHVLGVTRSELLLRRMDQAAPAEFDALVDRRVGHEPVAYITGRQEFYGLDLAVTPAVLIPRADSETLIEAAREAFAGRAPPRCVLDLGTGSGALLLAALTVWPEAEGLGIERDPLACDLARSNAERVGVIVAPSGRDARRPGEGGQVRFLRRDWTSAGWREGLGQFDLVLANPPYVETAADLAPSVRDFEPAGALFAGGDGLDDYRRLVPELPHLLAPGGCAVLEIGATQAAAVSALGEQAGFQARVVPDLGGRPRAIVLAI
jgi:release factor glutamine methyltransferase